MASPFVLALQMSADGGELAPLYSLPEEPTQVSEFEAGHRAGYDDALDDVREALLNTFAMPAQLVASLVAAAREHGATR